MTKLQTEKLNVNEVIHDREKFAAVFDHTILRPDATFDDVRKICAEAIKYHFASVCVNSCHAALVSDMLKDTGIKTCCVVGFPLGACTSQAKAFEAKCAVDDGAEEIDMVINVGYLKSGAYDMVQKDIEAVVAAVFGRAAVKVIIETCLLNDEEKVTACKLAKAAGAHFVKTSTGFSTGGAKASDVRLMRETVGEKMGVKASGGIRDFETAEAMLEAGANRIGASASAKLIESMV